VTEFERQVVHAFNNYFQENDITGLAYRRKQSRFQSQIVDVVVDSPEIGYMAIECKSRKMEYSDRLNFKSDFSTNNQGHQIPILTEWAHQTGRTPALALEIRRGRGKPRQASIFQWETVQKLYSKDEAKSLKPKNLKEFRYNIIRDGSEYTLVENK